MLTALFRRLRSGHPRTPRPTPTSRRRSFLPRLEVLEDRLVPAFAAPVALVGVQGLNATQVESAYINSDSRPDLITANGSIVKVWLRNADGSYANALSVGLKSGMAVTSLAVGDLNGDGISDLVAADGTTNLTVLLLNSRGGLLANRSVSLPKPPNGGSQRAQTVAVGDLSGDGKLDIVVGAESAAYHWLQGWYETSKRSDFLATVLLGKGDGTFRGSSSTILDSNYESGDPRVPVAIGDLNGDGKADVVAATYGLYVYFDPPPFVGNYHVHLLTGDGRGNLQNNWSLWSNGQDSGFGPPALAVRDLNGDGRDDIVAAYPNSSLSLHISLSDPSTGLFSTTADAVSGTPTAVAVADVTGDGILDIVVANGGGGGVAVRPGNGDGTFAAPLSFAPGSSFPSMGMADLNGDGALDLVLVDGFFALQMLNDGVW